MKNNKYLISNFNAVFCAAIVSFIFFSFEFFAIFKSGYFFVNEVLLFSFVFTVCLILLTFVILKMTQINIKEFLINFVIFFFIGLYLVNEFWFQGYLSLNAMDKFLNGNQNLDELYHSTISESFISYGYPSILQNAPIELRYHAFSHFIFSLLSRLFQLPALIIYNYLYPVIFVPLFVYLLIICLSKVKEKMGFESKLSIVDFLYLFLAICFIFPRALLNATGLFLDSIYISESCFISILFCLIFVKLACCDVLRKNILFKIVIIPLFILLTSFAKISTGLIFVLGIDWYFFRKDGFNIKRYLWCVFYLLVFLGYYKYTAVLASSIVEPDPIKIHLLDFCKNYCIHDTYILFYFVLLFPSLLLLYLFRKDFNINIFKSNNIKMILIEMSILLNIGSFLPGLFLHIGGGSAIYFSIPAYFLSLMLILVLQIPDKIYNYLLQVKICFVFILTLLLSLAISVNFFNNAFSVLKYRMQNSIYIYDHIHNKKGILETLFSSTKYANSNMDKTFNEIRSITKDAKKDYCIFLDDSCFIYSRYDRTFSGIMNKLRPNFAVTAYTGLPLINSVYINNYYYINNLKNRNFVRGDGYEFGYYKNIASYSMPPIVCEEFDRHTDKMYYHIKDLDLRRKTYKEEYTVNLSDYPEVKKYKYVIILYLDTYKIIEIK